MIKIITRYLIIAIRYKNLKISPNIDKAINVNIAKNNMYPSFNFSSS